MIPFCSLSPFSFGLFFFLKISLFSLSLLTCFFLHSPSFFPSFFFLLLFFLYLLFPYLLFFVSSFTFILRKKLRFILCPCRDAEAFFPPFKRKKTYWSHPRSIVKNQIACVVKIVLCELRIGRKPQSMSSLLHYLLFLNCCICFCFPSLSLSFIFLSIVSVFSSLLYYCFLSPFPFVHSSHYSLSPFFLFFSTSLFLFCYLFLLHCVFSLHLFFLDLHFSVSVLFCFFRTSLLLCFSVYLHLLSFCLFFVSFTLLLFLYLLFFLLHTLYLFSPLRSPPFS